MIDQNHRHDAIPDVYDNAKRIISVRVNASDLGRMLAIAKPLRSGSSDVVRFMIRIGLLQLRAFFDREAAPAEFAPFLGAWGVEFAEHFKLDAASLYDLVNANASESAPAIRMPDIELIILAKVSFPLFLERLASHTRQSVTPKNASAVMREYFQATYPSAGTTAFPKDLEGDG